MWTSLSYDGVLRQNDLKNANFRGAFESENLIGIDRIKKGKRRI